MKGALSKVSEKQEPNFSLNTPSHVRIFTTKTLELTLNKLPQAARKAFRVDDIPHNLVAVCTLVDAGCSVHVYGWGFEIIYNGEVIYKGWREKSSNLFQMSLQDDGTTRLTPDTDPSEYDGSNGMVMSAITWSVNSIYECQNKNQLIKYYHASLGSHPKRTLAAAARAGYLQGCPGLTQDAINKFIDVEEATEMGHMRAAPAGVRSTTSVSKRGRSRKEIHSQERKEASNDATDTPTQEPGNVKTRLVFMTVKLADGFIASDQTGAYPRTSNRGNKYICVFYIYDANHIKGIALKS